MSGFLKFNRAIAALAAVMASVMTVLGAADSRAAGLVTLKQVQVSGGSQIDLLFDGKISKGQLKTEYFNDIIQLSMSDVAVYPAKISSISGGDLMKVFAYQYAPRLVRCRISVRGKAEDYKDRFRIMANSPGGKVLTLALESGKRGIAAASDAMSVSASAPARSQAGSEAMRKAPDAGKVPEPKANEFKSGDLDDRALLDRVMKSTPALAQASADSRAEDTSRAAAHDRSSAAGDRARTASLSGAKPLPSFTALFVKLGLVLALFGLLAIAARKFLQLKQNGAIADAVATGKRKSGILGKLGSLGNKSKLIEVLSTQHLGPKKSIAVVKVMERVLVIGISSDSISLITQLGAGADPLLNLDGFEEIEDLPAPQAKPASGATAAGPAIFSDLLRSEASKPRIGASMSAPVAAKASAPTSPALNVPLNAPLSPASKNYLSAGGAGASASGAQQSGPSVSGPAYQSNIRAQIKSRIEGMKQL